MNRSGVQCTVGLLSMVDGASTDTSQKRTEDRRKILVSYLFFA